MIKKSIKRLDFVEKPIGFDTTKVYDYRSIRGGEAMFHQASTIISMDTNRVTDVTRDGQAALKLLLNSYYGTVTPINEDYEIEYR